MIGLVDLSISFEMSSEAEKIIESLIDSSSVSAQSVRVAFQLAERHNQAVIKETLGQDVRTSLFTFSTMACPSKEGFA